MFNLKIATFCAQRMKRELKILYKLHHPNIIKLEGKIFHKDHEIYSMVFPWMDEGDLKGYLLEKRKKASLNERLDIVSLIGFTTIPGN